MNALWFLSLVISITCALLATLLQQWARRYLQVTQPHYKLHERARIRSFFAEGVEKSFLPLAVEALPTLLHLSLLLFFAGLVVFLWNINLTIFKLALSWVGVCTAFYGCITLIPIFRRDSPYYTPLTPLARLIVIVILRVYLLLRDCIFALLWNCAGCCCCCFSIFRYVFGEDLRDRLAEFRDSTLMTTKEVALNSPPSIDTRAFMWTLDGLDEDSELERFFFSLPDFRSSKVVDDPLPSLTNEEKEKILKTVKRFLGFTFSPDLLPEAVKSQRAIMCAKALDPAVFSGQDLCCTVFDAYYLGPRTTNFGPIADENRTEQTVFVQGIVTGIITRQQHDDSWFRQVAPNALGIPETILRDYAANGDSLPLALLIYVTRQQFTYLHYSSWPIDQIRDVLVEGSKFNAQDTSPDLQHEFCTLWNQIVLKAQNDDDLTVAQSVLGPIRNIYVTLHHNTDSAPTQFSTSTGLWDGILSQPSSYPVCKVAGHVHGNSTSTSISCTVLHETTALLPPSLAPSLLIPVPLHDIESPADVPSLNNFNPAQRTIEGLRIPITSADLATASVIREIDTSGITMPHPTPETSTIASLSSPSPPAVVFLHHNADHLAPHEPINFPSSATSNLILDNILQTSPSLSLLLLITQSDPSHRSIIDTTAPSVSPGMTSTSDLRVSTKDDGSHMPGSREEMDALDPNLVDRAIHANTMATPDLSLQPPPLLSISHSDVAITGPSPRGPNAEPIGDNPPDPSHFQYDIV